MFKLLFCTICILFVVWAPNLQAQDFGLRGIISDRETGRPLELANVLLQKFPEGEPRGTTSDRNGLYQFDRVQTGEYIFMVRYLGYETFVDTLDLATDAQNIVMHIQLSASEEIMDEIRVGVETDVMPGRITIQPEDFRRNPTPAGSADLAGYLQSQPGVVATGDRGGQLFVRGGTPSENLVLMDGTLVYQPFHIIGFFSIFPEDVISRVDFHAGGFGAEYRSRTSSVMDVRLKNGNLYNYNWSASVSPFVSDLLFEGPVVKEKSSILVSLRGSLIEAASDIYLAEQQPLRFNSQLVKYNLAGGEGFNCSAHFLRTFDRGRIDFDEGAKFKWNNFATGGRCAAVPEASTVSFMDLNFGVSYFSNEAGSTPLDRRFASILKSHLNLTLAANMGDWRLDYGFFTNLREFDYDLSAMFFSMQQNKETFLSAGGFVSVNIPLGENISLDPGISVAAYLNDIPTSLEPRLQFSWQPRGKTGEQLHAALGIYHQPLVGIADFRDAGTAFTAWMTAPDPERQMEARHALLGWQQPAGRYFTFSAEGYYKNIRNIPVSTWSTIAEFTTDLAYADGSVHGVDVRLDFSHRNIYLGIGYGYSVTEYESAQDHFGTWFGESMQRYHPAHDRRHQLNIQAGLEIGSFSANISWIYGSGMPFTRPIGFDSFFSFVEGPPDVTSRYGDPRILMDKPFQGRMPDFHRLDVSLEQAFEIQNVNVRVQGGAINTYDWENLFYYDVFDQKGINQLPLLPYVSLRFESN